VTKKVKTSKLLSLPEGRSLQK